MTKINLIFNENRNIQKEQSRLERMGLKDELAIVSDEHLLASAKPDQVYYDSQRKCGCFWSGVLDNEDELRSLWIQYRPQSTGNSAKMLAQLYEILSEKLFEKLDGCFVIVFVQGHQLHIVRDPMGVKWGMAVLRSDQGIVCRGQPHAGCQPGRASGAVCVRPVAYRRADVL